MPDWSYRTLLRPLLFLMPPKRARDFTLRAMGTLSRLPFGPPLIDLLGHMRPSTALKFSVFDVEFPGVVGVGAGLDQEWIALAALSRFGVGFLEIGPLTLAALGSPDGPKRLSEQQAILYPDLPENIGVEAMAKRLEATSSLSVPIGARIAHHPEADPQDAAVERAQIMMRLAPHVTISFWTRAGAQRFGAQENGQRICQRSDKRFQTHAIIQFS